MGHYTGARLAVQLQDVVYQCELTNCRLHGITTDISLSNYSMTCELQSTLEPSEMEWPAWWKHIPCTAHVIQLTLRTFSSSLGGKGGTKSWNAHERDQQFGENESIDIGKSPRLQKPGNARINKVSAIRPGFTMIIEEVSNS